MSLIYSMTGYASAQGSAGELLAYALTMKSVNHRFLDLHLRLPSYLDAVEAHVRGLLKESVRRGHVELTLQVERRSGGAVQLNTELLNAYMQAFRSAGKIHGVEGEADLTQMLRIPGVMSVDSGMSRADMSLIEAAVLADLGGLVERFNSSRAEEGASLAAQLRGSMRRLGEFAAKVCELRGGVRDAQFQRLQTRIGELMQGVQVSEERLLTEAALLAERSDVDEETVRLRTHVDRFVTLLDEGGELGKRLDFLLQELNREANTMLSKTSGAAGPSGLRITELGLEMKSEIEKAREQVQNLE